MILWCIIFVVGFVYVFLYKNLLKARRHFKWLPHAPSLPLIGSVREFGDRTERLSDLTRLTDNPQKMCYLEIANTWHLMVRSCDFTEFILSSVDTIDKSVDYAFFRDWLRDGLITSNGTKWKKKRKILTPAFHFSILDQFVEVFNTNSEVLIGKLDLNAAEEKPFDIFPYVNLCALDIICEAAMGLNIQAQNHQNQNYVEAVADFCRIAVLRVYSVRLRFGPLFRLSTEHSKQKSNLKILHEFSNAVIESRKRDFYTNEKSNAGGGTRKLAFLDLLLNLKVDGQPLPQECIREEVDTFMFAGHDTTSIAISLALYLLANHIHVQDLVRGEQKIIFESDKNRAVTLQNLQQMKYLELVIKETLRLYPSAPIVARNLHKDIVYNGHTIPKGTSVNISIYGMHHDPDYFESPEEFRPERFRDTPVKPFSYVPFSAGPRNCIGQRFAMLEMKCVIAKIVRNFELSPAGPPSKLEMASDAVLHSLNGVKVKLKRCNFRC